MKKIHKVFTLICIIQIVVCIGTNNYIRNIEKNREIQDLEELQLIKDKFSEVFNKDYMKTKIDSILEYDDIAYIWLGDSGYFSFLSSEEWYPNLKEIKEYMMENLKNISSLNSINGRSKNAVIYLTIDQTRHIEVFVSDIRYNKIPAKCRELDGLMLR